MIIDGFMSPLFYTSQIGETENLAVLNGDLTEVQFNGPGWRKVFEMVVNAVQSGAFYLPSEEEASKAMRTLEDDRFITGRSAMTFQSAYQIGSILGAKNNLKQFKPINWGIVTAPVDPNNRTLDFLLKDLIARELAAAIKDEKTLDEVQTIQEEGQALLVGMKANRK